MSRPRNDQHTQQRHEVAQRLRHARETTGLSQTQAAIRVGIGRTGMCEIENGDRNVSAYELVRFAKLYRRNPTWLLGLSDDPPVESDVLAALSGLHPDDRALVVAFAKFLSIERQLKNVGYPHARVGPAAR